MPATKIILTSVHGRRVGLGQDGKLVINGRTAIMQDDTGAYARIQGAPGTLNATGTLLTTDLLKGIVTSTTASAVSAALPESVALDTALDIAIGESIDWRVIVTGATNAWTLGAVTGHTLVGNAVVSAATSATFRTRKTAAATFVTYRV